MRKSTYKEKIISFLEKRHLASMAEIHQHINQVDFSTIYRNVNQLLNDKKIKAIFAGKDLVKYELASHHHDHLVCNNCGKISEIKARISREDIMDDFFIEEIIIRGLCADCK